MRKSLLAQWISVSHSIQHFIQDFLKRGGSQLPPHLPAGNSAYQSMFWQLEYDFGKILEQMHVTVAVYALKPPYNNTCAKGGGGGGGIFERGEPPSVSNTVGPLNMDPIIRTLFFRTLLLSPSQDMYSIIGPKCVECIV